MFPTPGVRVITYDGKSEENPSLDKFTQKEYKKMSDVSDGYHSFGELYRYRMLLQALLFNEWAISDMWAAQPDSTHHNYHVEKSWRHYDGELCFGKENYFIVTAELPTGQISNHYKGEFWDLFHVPAVERAAKWDGHTPEDAMRRMEEYITTGDQTP